MQDYPTLTVAPPGPKNYVFVDEHNRHKRLKVMRACEGCRRRKIKCDSATTNTWPCAACVRLKLPCVPPVGGADGDPSDPALGPRPAPGPAAGAGPDDAFDAQHYAPSQPTAPGATVIPPATYPPDPAGPAGFQMHDAAALPYDVYLANYQKPAFAAVPPYYPAAHPYPGAVPDPYQSQSGALEYGQMLPVSEEGRQHRADSSTSDQTTAEDLMGHFGQLMIGENGVAAYLRPEKDANREPEGPLQDPEPEPSLAAVFRTGAGSQIRIPPALMPSDEEAIRAFRTFFRDVHPYVPVLNRSQFYHQWHNDRQAISPLVLEAVLANAGRLSDDPAQGAQWLAMANKHEASFLDQPRLSTLQALLLLLKARESAPKRGYYYRSWMTCKTAVTMAKDLELHEHHETHSAGEDCGSDPIECLVKTRVWQTLLICETMVGGPQGRTDLGVDPNSVDISTQPPHADVDDFERSISRQFAYFVRNVRNIRLITDVSQKLKKKKDWGLDQAFVAHNAAFQHWPDELPQDLRVTFPPTGAPAVMSSHFLANMHSHYHLGVVMLHRPQLAASQSFAVDSQGRQHMDVCYQSAKILCRLQEGILARFGLTGLLCMQRGINFTIYAILTCTMIHLLAVVSPDPEYNVEAKDYFERQMRILERCIAAWPMPETEAQVNALRAAFSMDISKPFELKMPFLLGSPSDHSRSSPGSQATLERQQSKMLEGPPPQQQAPYIPPHLSQVRSQTPYLATPPTSAFSSVDSKPPTPIYAPTLDVDQQYPSMPPTAAAYYQQPTSAPDLSWNPTPIINQFDTAFAIPASALGPPSSLYSPSSASPQSNVQNLQASFTSTGSPTYVATSQSYAQQQANYFAMQQAPPTQPPYPGTSPTAGTAVQMPPTVYGNAALFVTPRQWQQSVASAIDPSGLKRRWDFDHQ